MKHHLAWIVGTLLLVIPQPGAAQTRRPLQEGMSAPACFHRGSSYSHCGPGGCYRLPSVVYSDPGMTMLTPHSAPGIAPSTVPTVAQPGAADEELPAPSLSLLVQVPAQITTGQELEYRVLVENRSSAAAHHVVVKDRLPSNARFVRADPPPAETMPELLWSLGSMNPGDRWEMKLVLAPTGPGEITNCLRVALEHGARLTTAVTQPMLSLRKSGPGQAQLNDALTYTLTVTNGGTAPAEGVEIVDQLPEGLETKDNRRQLSFNIGTLPPGETKSATYEVIAKASGQHRNRAVATAQGGLRDEVESMVNVTEPRLEIAMTGPLQQSFNRSALYRITVQNPGTAPLSNLRITNRVPANAAFVSASDGGRMSEGQVEWILGGLSPGASRVLELKLRPQTAGILVNQAVAVADRGLAARAEVRTEIVGAAGVLMELVDTEDPVEIGAETVYEITVVNQGTIPATNIRIVATVPAEMAAVRVQGPTDHKTDGAQVTFAPLNLPPREQTVYRITVKALMAGDVRFRVQMSTDQLAEGGPVMEEESTTIFDPAGDG